MHAISMLVFLLLASERLDDPPSGTSEEFASRIRAIASGELESAFSPTWEARKAAIIWLDHHAGDNAALDALTVLERVAKKDRSPTLRGMAVQTVGEIASRHHRPCPLVVIDAILDREESEDLNRLTPSRRALYVLEEYHPLPVAAVGSVLRLARSNDPFTRISTLDFFKAYAEKGPENLKAIRNIPEIIKAIRAAKMDSDLRVQLSAAWALFKISDQLIDILPFLLRFQEDVNALPEPPRDPKKKDDLPFPPDPERVRIAYLRLGSVAVAMHILKWEQERPAEVGEILVGLLDDKDARTRRVAASNLGELAATAAKPPAKTPDEAGAGIFETDLVKAFRDADAKANDEISLGTIDSTKLHKGAVIICAHPRLRERLKRLAEMDPDEPTRKEAKSALDKVRKLPTQ